MAVQNTNVNVAAMTARATPACAARVDVDELPVLLEAGGEPDEVLDRRLEVDRVEDVVLNPLVLEVDTPVVEGMMGEDAPVAGVDEPGVVLLLPPVRYDGAATALEGSASAPVPQAIGCPLGWAEFGGGTVTPVESAMANRPVHERFCAAGDVNW